MGSPSPASRCAAATSWAPSDSVGRSGPAGPSWSRALGKKFELVPFDNKSQPSDALIALKSATDQNMPFIMQCSGSNIAAALIEAVDKHNSRNPDSRIIYVNCGAVATELTNEKCSFWHFR